MGRTGFWHWLLVLIGVRERVEIVNICPRCRRYLVNDDGFCPKCGPGAAGAQA